MSKIKVRMNDNPMNDKICSECGKEISEDEKIVVAIPKQNLIAFSCESCLSLFKQRSKKDVELGKLRLEEFPALDSEGKRINVCELHVNEKTLIFKKEQK